MLTSGWLRSERSKATKTDTRQEKGPGGAFFSYERTMKTPGPQETWLYSVDTGVKEGSHPGAKKTRL